MPQVFNKGSNTQTRRPKRRPGGHAGLPVYGAIDLGTNNCRLLLARPAQGDNKGDNKGGIHVIDGFSRIVRLGEGVQATGRLSNEAIERTIGALKVCAHKIKDRGAVETRSIATQACRQAANGQEFMDRVKRETGLDMKVIAATEEAELTLAGCAPLLKTGHSRALMFDIGGGSTELMWVETAPEKEPKALDILSLPIGVVNLAEEYGKDPLTPEVFEQIVDRIDADLAPFEDRNRIAPEIDAGNVHVLGTSGTVTTLGAIYLDLPRYDRARVDGLDIRTESIHPISAKLAGLDFQARNDHPCIGPGRADLMVMGCAVLSAIVRRWPVLSLTAADRGIREGLLLSMMAARQEK